jgi:hypothetical protein
MSSPGDTPGGRVRPAALTLDAAALGALTDPVLLVALRGYFDMATVATSALDAITSRESAVTVGEIDPDPFYDFTVERPTIELVDDDGEQLSRIFWPSNEIRVVRTGAGHDLVALDGVEPHLAWNEYVDCVLAIVAELGVGLVVTLGAAAETTPHTRMPVVVGSTTDTDLARRFGLSAPSYQGITGLVGVLQTALEAARVPSVSLRVGVPHYLSAGEHPRGVVSLVRHVAHVLDVPLPVDLDASIAFWDEQHSIAVGDDPQLERYVRSLESAYDRRAEASLASGDELAAQFEQFLRDQPPDPD